MRIMVHHRHGEDIVGEGDDEGEVLEELEKYCRYWWDEVSDEEPPEGKDEVIAEYFAKREDEWWEFR